MPEYRCSIVLFQELLKVQLSISALSDTAIKASCNCTTISSHKLNLRKTVAQGPKKFRLSQVPRGTWLLHHPTCRTSPSAKQQLAKEHAAAASSNL